MKSLIDLFGIKDFIPHGYCLSWSPVLLWLNVTSDLLITTAYYSIPLTLIYFARKRKDQAYPWLVFMVAGFIVACGTTHLLSAITIWIPLYWFDGLIKAFTAVLSIATAILMFWIIPRALSLPSAAQLQDDIQRRIKVEKDLNIFKDIINSTDDAIMSKNMKGIIMSWNTSAQHMFGYIAEEIIGSPILKLFPPERIDEEKIILEQIAHGHRVNHFETIRIHKDGSHINVSVTLSPIFDSDGKIIGASKIVRDITERKQMEAQLQTLANTDPLTGLFNRRIFFERLEQEIAKVARLSDYLVVLLMLDLDFFKRINDAYGHAAGDEVLKVFAKIASNNVRSVDVLARLGGEEFAILLIGTDKNNAQLMAERLREEVADIVISHKLGSIKFTVSIGADCILADDINGEAVMHRADTALYEAKEKGRNQICFFQ